MERPGASQGFGFINVPEHLAGMFSVKLWEDFCWLFKFTHQKFEKILGISKNSKKILMAEIERLGHSYALF